jgi:6-phosphogluconolactonase
LKSAASKQGRASILLSGGSTPQAAYQLLAGADLPWDQLQISLTDERRVDDGHEASNAVMIWQSFLAKHPQVEWFPLWQTGWSCGDLAEIKARTAEMQRPFDVVILGMGEDGHFASLFPGCEASIASLNGKSDRLLCTIAPNAPQERISWSMDALLEAKSLMLYVTGEKKRSILEAALKGGALESELPIGYFLRAIQREGKKLQIFWSAT